MTLYEHKNGFGYDSSNNVDYDIYYEIVRVNYYKLYYNKLFYFRFY